MGIRFPLRRQYVFTSCIGDADCEASDIGHWLRNDSFLGSAVQVQRAGGGVRPYTGEGMRCVAGHMGLALHYTVFVGQGPCALPGVRWDGPMWGAN